MVEASIVSNEERKQKLENKDLPGAKFTFP